MNVEKNLVQAHFDAILSGNATREAVSDWARELREAHDRNDLAISPEVDRPQLWKAILFLEGVDLRDAPDSYLHNEEDIRRERP